MTSTNKASGGPAGGSGQKSTTINTHTSGNKITQPIASRVQVPRPNKIARPDVDEVNRAAEGFLQMYYDFMDAPLRNANIINMYRETSTMLWNGQTLTGAEKIKEFLGTVPESKHEIQSWDCHPIPGYTPAPILITVSGTVTHGAMPAKIPPNKKPGLQPRVFSQTFVIAPEVAAGVPPTTASSGVATEGVMYYIRADTLRFVG